jgi:multidrug efflux pump subunit AcrA (membrane-fusion protein)
MSFNLTNRTAAPALNGQDALVNLNWSDANGNGLKVYVGESAGVVSSGKLGTVSFVDPNGLYVKVKPAQPNARFDSTSTPGQLAVNETITFF